MSTDTTQPANSGPLSLDQFADAIEAPAVTVEEPEEEEAVESEEEEADEITEPSADDEADEADSDADEEADAEEEAVEDAPPAPASWAKEDHAIWAKLPPEARAVIAKREADRDRATAEAAQKAGQAGAQLKVIAEQYEKYAPVFADGFTSRWGNVDWVGLAQKVSAEEYNQLRAEMEDEKQALAEYEAKAQEASEAAFRAFLQEELPKLKRLAPEIAEPGEPRTKFLGYLHEQGFEPEQIKHASAAELTIAFKAMKYDESQKRAKSQAAQPRKNPVSTAKPTPTGGSQGGAASPQRNLQVLSARLTKTGSIDAYADLLNAEEEQRTRKARAK